MESQISSAAQVIISIIPIVGIVFAAIILFFALLWKHSETKMRIRQGINSETKFNLKVFSLLGGLCLSGIGIVLTLIFALLSGISWAILGGVVPLSIGLSLLAFYKLNPEFKNK